MLQQISDNYCINEGEEMDNYPISERLKKCRNEKGMSQQEIANALNVQRQIISYYETGKRQPNITDIVKLAELYNISADYILGLSDVATTDENMKYICGYTGLSEKAVKKLNESKDSGYITNLLLEYRTKEQDDDVSIVDLISAYLSFRENNYSKVIISSFSKKPELAPLLKEKGVIDFIESPYSKEIYSKAVQSILLQEVTKMLEELNKDLNKGGEPNGNDTKA